MTAARIPALQPADPPDADAGELTGPARAQFRQPHVPLALTVAPPAPPAGVDLYENSAWFADATVTFMVLKAFEYREDAKFAARWPLVAPRYRGAYLFGHPALDPDVQAGEFVSVLRAAGFAPGDRPWLDFEVSDGKSPSYCAKWAGECCAEIDGLLDLPLGTTGVYTYPDFIWQGNCAGLGTRPLWLARPSPLGPWAGGVNLGPWAAPSLVQYQVTTIDWDYFNGPAGGLAAFWGTQPAPQAPANWTETLMADLPTLVSGATGEDVRSVQGLLTARGYPVAVDGQFGAATKAAVQSLQRARGLAADGVVGAHTWPALLGRAG